MSVNVYDPVNDTLIPIAGATLYSDVPVGFIGAFDAEEVPDGWLIFNGQTVLRSDYPDLWARANRNNQVGVGKFYGIGDGSTTFTLADLRETSLKGYGETSRSVGAHVKSGGLGVGEFIDDRIQDHSHRNYVDQNISFPFGIDWSGGTENISTAAKGSTTGLKVITGGPDNARSGTTTEVKAVGVVWAVKAKMTGLPIDLKEQIDAPDSSAWVAQTYCDVKIKNGIVFVRIMYGGSNITITTSPTEIARLTDTRFIPLHEIDFVAIDNSSADKPFHARIRTDGSIVGWGLDGGSFTTSYIKGMVSYPREQ